MKNEPTWEEMNDFEKWFYGSDVYADGDLEKDQYGAYVMPMTEAFEECWNVASYRMSRLCE